MGQFQAEKTVTGDVRPLQQLRTPSTSTFAGKQEDSVAGTPRDSQWGARLQRSSVPSVEGPRWPLLILFALFLTRQRWHYLIGISKRILWLLLRNHNRRAVQRQQGAPSCMEGLISSACCFPSAYLTFSTRRSPGRFFCTCCTRACPPMCWLYCSDSVLCLGPFRQ